MKAMIDNDLCIGCGLCGELCPEVFHEGDDGKFSAIDEPVPEDQEDCAQDAESQCPVEAISVE